MDFRLADAAPATGPEVREMIDDFDDWLREHPFISAAAMAWLLIVGLSQLVQLYAAWTK